LNWTLVTGAAQRLGRSIALELAARGHAIAVHYHTSAREAAEVVKACRAKGVMAEMIQGDFSTPESTAQFIERYLAQFPTTKYLVNNVGNYLLKSASQTSDSEWQEVFQSNLFAPMALMRALLPSLKKEKGSIVNIGFAGAGGPAEKSTAYSIAKNALWMLTRALALELAPDGVRVNLVSPGHLQETIVPVDVRTLPMQRLGLPEEVVRAIAFFLDDQNGYITGQNIEVAGGVRL
jgi:NAD(P)-dependent dehydrogenase (short-subunit alcohol dehydrogenase family)